MTSFTAPLLVEILDARRDDRVLARLLEGFAYDVGREGSGETIRVPAGYVTDFASVPRAFWAIEPPLGPAGKAAVVHDWLYATTGLHGRYTRAEADAIFREALKVLGVSKLKRNLLYAAVRVGGGGGWARAAAENARGL